MWFQRVRIQGRRVRELFTGQYSFAFPPCHFYRSLFLARLLFIINNKRHSQKAVPNLYGHFNEREFESPRIHLC